jgi:pimeloyl-ACP methyl ester carboxylesterase
MTLDRRTVMAAAGWLAASATAAPALARAPAADMAGPWTTRGDVTRGGGCIHYATLGTDTSRPPLVLLPKLGGWLADWRHAAPYLAAGRRVIAMDPPGHGGSRMLGPPPFAQTLPESAAMILAALDQIGVQRFALAGNSLGGDIGIVMAALYPQHVEKLALVSVSLIGGVDRATLAAQEAAMPQGLFTKDWRPLPRTGDRAHDFGTLDPAVIAEQEQSRARCDRWVRPSERGVALAGVASYLPHVQAPTLLVYADRGHYTKFEATGRAALRDVQVSHIAGAGSFVHQEKPAETAAALNAFFNG